MEKSNSTLQAFPEINSMNSQELTAFLTGIGEKPFRAKQIYAWLHQRQAAHYI